MGAISLGREFKKTTIVTLEIEATAGKICGLMENTVHLANVLCITATLKAFTLK